MGKEPDSKNMTERPCLRLGEQRHISESFIFHLPRSASEKQISREYSFVGGEGGRSKEKKVSTWKPGNWNINHFIPIVLFLEGGGFRDRIHLFLFPLSIPFS